MSSCCKKRKVGGSGKVGCERGRHATLRPSQRAEPLGDPHQGFSLPVFLFLRRQHRQATMETPTSVEASSDEPDVGGLAEQLASASVSEGKKTGKTVKEWSRAVKLIDSKTIQHEFLHPACLEFAPADLDSRYSSVMRCISPAFFVVGLYKIIPEGANEAQGADEQTSKAKESDGESSTEAAEEGDEEVSSCGEFPTSRKQERKGGISLYRLEYPKL